MIIHAVTSGSGFSLSIRQIILACSGQVDAICLREKAYDEAAVEQAVHRLIKAGVPPDKFILHSQPDLAAVLPVKGCHFSEHDSRLAAFKQHCPDKTAGQSVHSVEAAQQAESNGADYVYFGHVYPTSSKPGLPARGLEKLQAVCEAVSIPVIAIGGIDASRLTEIQSAGAKGAAMISAFFKKEEAATCIHTTQL